MDPRLLLSSRRRARDTAHGGRRAARARRQARCDDPVARAERRACLGTRLRQEALAEEFGVSRTPVREALRKLQASGLVELRPNRGAQCRGPRRREIRDAYEVRVGSRASPPSWPPRESGMSNSTGSTRRRRTSAPRSSDTVQGRAEPPSRKTRRSRVRGRASDHLATRVILGGRQRGARSHARAPPSRLPATHAASAPRERDAAARQRARACRDPCRALERGDAAAARELMVNHPRRAGGLVAVSAQSAALHSGTGSDASDEVELAELVVR